MKNALNCQASHCCFLLFLSFSPSLFPQFTINRQRNAKNMCRKLIFTPLDFSLVYGRRDLLLGQKTNRGILTKTKELSSTYTPPTQGDKANDRKAVKTRCKPDYFLSIVQLASKHVFVSPKPIFTSFPPIFFEEGKRERVTHVKKTGFKKPWEVFPRGSRVSFLAYSFVVWF